MNIQCQISNVKCPIGNWLICLLVFIGTYSIFPFTAHAQTATLSLSPASGTFNKSCTFSLQINLNTGGVQTDGTDAILIYDSSRFTATSITSGTIYPDYPGNNIDETDGKITVSGLASISSAFSGSGTLATVNFTVNDTTQTGATQIKFDFDPNDKAKTTDSNVVERGTVADILNSVTNGSYTIGTGTCAAASPSPGAVGTGAGAKGGTGVATPSGAETIDQLVDRTGKGPGTSELTMTLAIVGSVLTVLGILGLALL